MTNKKIIIISIFPIILFLYICVGYFFPTHKYFSCKYGDDERAVYIDLKKHWNGVVYGLNGFSLSQCTKYKAMFVESFDTVTCLSNERGSQSYISFDYKLGRIIGWDDIIKFDDYVTCERITPADD
jgi:hypothetical protein